MKSKGPIFITGGTGFIGRHLIDWLCKLNYEVHALYRDSSKAPVSQTPFVQWVPQSKIRESFRNIRPTAVIHLATQYGRSNLDILNVIDANIRLPLELAELAIETACPILLSTDSFYGKAGVNYNRLPLYTKSKASFLDWAKNIEGINNSLKIVNMRLEHVYGPFDGVEKFTSHVVQAMLNNRPLSLTEGHQERDFIYVSDVVRAYETVLAKSDSISVGISELEVGSGQATSLRNFVQLIRKNISSTSELKFGALPMQQGEIMRSIADNKKLNALGWEAKVDVENGVQLMLGAEGHLYKNKF